MEHEGKFKKVNCPWLKKISNTQNRVGKYWIKDDVGYAIYSRVV